MWKSSIRVIEQFDKHNLGKSDKGEINKTNNQAFVCLHHHSINNGQPIGTERIHTTQNNTKTTRDEQHRFHQNTGSKSCAREE